MLYVRQFSCLAGGVLAVENPLGKHSYAGDSWFFAGTGGLSAQFKRGQVNTVRIQVRLWSSQIQGKFDPRTPRHVWHGVLVQRC